MDKRLTRQECLILDIKTYNSLIEQQWEKDKISKNLSGELKICKHCGRKCVICCICDESIKEWNKIVEEIREMTKGYKNE